jgi:hypothetical protein
MSCLELFFNVGWLFRFSLWSPWWDNVARGDDLGMPYPTTSFVSLWLWLSLFLDATQSRQHEA